MKKWWLLLLLLVTEVIYFLINRSFGSVHFLRTTIDNSLPVVPFFVIPYLVFHLFFWLTIGYAFIHQRKFVELISAVVVYHLIAYIAYFTYQTAVTRPDIQPIDLPSKILLWLYAHDKPFNALPSLHTTGSIVTASYYFNIDSRYKWLIGAFCITVIFSTVLIKQHYLIDVLAGIILGSGVSLFFFRRKNVDFLSRSLSVFLKQKTSR